MRITESRLRQIIRNVIKETDNISNTYSIKKIDRNVINMSKRLYFEFGISEKQCLTANKVDSSVINIYQGLANYINDEPDVIVKGKENKQIVKPEDFLFIKKGTRIKDAHSDLRGISQTMKSISSMNDTDEINREIDKARNKNTNENKKLLRSLFEFRISGSGGGNDGYFNPHDAYSAIINHPSITKTDSFFGKSGNIVIVCPDRKGVSLKMAELEFPPGELKNSVDGDEVKIKVFISNDYVILLGIESLKLAYGETQTF